MIHPNNCPFCNSDRTTVLNWYCDMYVCCLACNAKGPVITADHIGYDRYTLEHMNRNDDTQRKEAWRIQSLIHDLAANKWNKATNNHD